jgi:serine/threonine protein phosphatase PrpC
MSEDRTSHLLIGVLSHPGEKREINEDSFGISSYQLEENLTPTVLAVVADGIGGHQAGEVASQLTVDTIMNTLSREGASQPLEQLRWVVRTAGKLVAETALRSPEYYGMGSTVAIAWVIGKKLYTAHVGDSRIYLLRDGILRQTTIDHTWVQEAIKHEIIRPEEARNHPRAHVLHTAIGSQDPPEPDFRLCLSNGETDLESEDHQGLTLMRGDRILLCSDGLTDLVEDYEIRTALEEQIPEEAVQSLVSLARARGGHDNITVIILGVPDDWPEEKPAPKRKILRLILLALFSGIILTILAAIVVFGMLPLIDRDGKTPTPSINETTPIATTSTDSLLIPPPRIAESPIPAHISTPLTLSTHISRIQSLENWIRGSYVQFTIQTAIKTPYPPAIPAKCIASPLNDRVSKVVMMGSKYKNTPVFVASITLKALYQKMYAYPDHAIPKNRIVTMEAHPKFGGKQISRDRQPPPRKG